MMHPIRHVVPWTDIIDQLDEELPFPQKKEKKKRGKKEMAVTVNKDNVGVVLQDENDKKLFAFFRKRSRGRKGADSDGQDGNLSDESEEIKSSYRIQSEQRNSLQMIAH